MAHISRSIAFLLLDGGKDIGGNQIQQSLDTIEYRVFVAVDKAGVEHWGGKEAYQAKLNAFSTK